MKVWLTIKDDSVEVDAAAKWQFNSTDNPTQVEITDAPAGALTVHFLDTDTTDLEGEWSYDLQVLTAGGQVITFARGRIEFLENLTRTVA